MNNHLKLVGLLVAILGSSSAMSANSIAILDTEELLSKAPQAEEASKRLESEFQARKDDLESKQEILKGKQEKLQRDKDILSEVDRKKAEKELGRLHQELRQNGEKFSAEYTSRNRDEMEKLSKLVKEVVSKVAVDEKIDVVLNNQATLYNASSVDITAKVIEALNKLPRSPAPEKAAGGKADDKKEDKK